MIEIGTVLQDRYVIEKQIGEGGMGAVFLAVDRRFDNHVAIKETFYHDDEFGEAFEREARLLNSLRHPVLPHVSDYFTEAGGHFLVMQFIEGEDLSEIIKRQGAFPVEDVLGWTMDLLDALDYLHSHEPPVIHRDIKPQNLKITPRGDIILLDFGLAKLNSDDKSKELSVFGYSRKYSPLEQIQGTGTDARSDIFSLAATVYHLLTGDAPVDALARASAIVAGKPDPLRPVNEINTEITSAVASVLHSALALNADKRFVSAKAARQALEFAINLNSGETVEDPPEKRSNVFELKNENVNSTGEENFPALAAFAFNAAGNSPVADDGRYEAVKIPVSDAQVSPPVPEVMTVNKTPNETMLRPVRSRITLAAAATILLLLVGLAAGYSIYRASSSNELSQTAAVQTASDANSKVERSEAITDIPQSKTAGLPESETTEQAQTKPTATEKIVEKEQSADEQTVSEERTEPVKLEPAQTKITQIISPVKSSRRSEPERPDPARPRVVESESVPDIESIFTGRSSGKNDKSEKKDDRRQPKQKRDEDRKEKPRQRNEERKPGENKDLF